MTQVVRWLRPFPLLLCILPLVAGGFEYREALPGYKYQFPRDHFEHEDFRTEWWYYTGNVTGAQGERFGFELVFFRQGQRHDSENKSRWDVQDVYLAHAALTDARGKRFRYEERLNRKGPGVAGASFAERRIWNGNWSSKWSGNLSTGVQTLDALTPDFRFHLQLSPQKTFVIQGENGISQKAAGRGRASYYVSFPLLAVSGSVNSTSVSGTAWMDHEWFTEQLAPGQAGWDWFSIQLANRTELMLFQLRHTDGSIDPYSSGTFIDQRGTARHLKREDFSLQPLSRWQKYPMLFQLRHTDGSIGPYSSGTFIDQRGTARHLKREDFSLQPLSRWQKYPIEWRIQVPSLNIDLRSRAILPDQELRINKGGSSYWEGAVDYSGTHAGVGYLEMTGYEKEVRF